MNAGLPEIDEAATLVSLVGKIQGVSPLPLQIDSSDPIAVEAAVRVFGQADYQLRERQARKP